MPLSAQEINELIFKIEQNSSAVVKLDLSAQTLSEAQLKRIAAALKHNYHLKELILNRNFISDEVARIFGEALAINSNLAHLSLSTSGITEIGARSIALGLEDNDSLLHLGLSNCKIGSAGLRQLGIMLDKNKHLKSLAVDNNGLSTKAIKEFEHHVANHPSLTFLDIWGNTMIYIFDNDKYEVTDQCTKFIESDPMPCLSFLWGGYSKKPKANPYTHAPILGQARIKVRC